MTELPSPENPPGFIVRTEAQKAAASRGFRLERGIEAGWLGYGSTTAQVAVWIAGVSGHGPWLLSLDRAEVGLELGPEPIDAPPAPGVATFVFPTLTQLYDALDRVYRLGVSLPDAPLNAFRKATEALPRTTEVERLVVQRVGQDLFRQALIDYWDRRCALTGITDLTLLRASHIVPWAECNSDAHRLDVHNGLLLSALWDAAFDAGLVSFTDDGAALAAPSLSAEAAAALRITEAGKLTRLTAAHRANLAWHRSRHGIQGYG